MTRPSTSGFAIQTRRRAIFCRCSHGCQTFIVAIRAAGRDGIVPPCRVLAVELDTARRSHVLSVLSALAGLHPRLWMLWCAWRAGTSLWTRSRKEFCPVVFFFPCRRGGCLNVINERTGNWEYLGADSFTPLEYYALCTLSFSTVMPAVFETAELVRTFRLGEIGQQPGARISDSPRTHRRLLSTGLVMLALTLLWPKFFYPFVWISLVLILEPLNRWLGRPHFLQWLQHGDWRPMHFAVARRVDLRILLGDVEFLVVAEMDIPHAGRKCSSRF